MVTIEPLNCIELQAIPRDNAFSAPCGSQTSPSLQLQRRPSEVEFDCDVHVSEATCELLYYSFAYGFLNDYYHLPFGAYHLHSGDDKVSASAAA